MADVENVDTGATAPADPDAEAAPAEVKEELIPLEILEDMQNLWSVFEMGQTNEVPISELQVIMRALDFDLNETELEICRK
jgi:hypothetical protein